MTEQQTPAAPEQQAPPKPTAPKAGEQNTPAGSEKQPPWGKPENFDADKAWELIQNLRNEKGNPDPQLRSELTQMQQAMQEQRDALATALGVKPEETSDADKLAQQIESLRGQIVASERRALAVEFKVPEAMLTATTADDMRQQAQALVEFANAAHFAAATHTSSPSAPAFQQNPGQGQGGAPSGDPMVGFEQYYDPETGRPRF